MAPGLPSPDGLNETLQSFCLCDGSGQCGRKATGDTTADSSEPDRDVQLGIPKISVTPGRRRKREATRDRDDSEMTTGNPRIYFTHWKYWRFE